MDLGMVLRMDLTPERLRAALEGPGTGSSDFDLNPEFRLPPGRRLRPAAVLIAIGDAPGGASVLLTKRASGLRHHAGQIALPGGKIDPTDADATAAALREAEEEVGLPPALVQPLGYLPPHETVTGYTVTPVLAHVSARFDPVPLEAEVEEAFFVPLAHLADPSRYRVERRLWLGQWRSYYIVPWGPYYIWGATARMLRMLAERLPR
jgi:8-oxo-dGTP pyrophosphatase MutT (NUDIX family)